MSGQVTSECDEFDEEEDEEDMDRTRAKQIKELMFKTYRVPNQQGMNVNEFVSDLGEIFPDRSGDDAPTLYQTLLNM